jgi:nucleoside-diphosphate-sugar epimerase
LIQKADVPSFLDRCDQVIVYGANGWLGRSAVDLVSSLSPKTAKEKLLLMGSKSSRIDINQIRFEIHDPQSGMEQIKENSIFFNSAFLRRELINVVGSEEYIKKNLEIMFFASNVIQTRKLQSFINLSSGAARDMEQKVIPDSADAYSWLKKNSENEFFEQCDKIGTSFVNCRIFSLSGPHINEFENLALGSFFKQAMNENQISVNAPLAKRTYLDAKELSQVLMTLASQGGFHTVDSGGVLTTMGELAQQIAKFFGNSNVKVSIGNQLGTEYFGEFVKFNRLARDLNIQLSGIERQIVSTSKAFNL